MRLKSCDHCSSFKATGFSSQSTLYRFLKFYQQVKRDKKHQCIIWSHISQQFPVQYVTLLYIYCRLNPSQRPVLLASKLMIPNPIGIVTCRLKFPKKRIICNAFNKRAASGTLKPELYGFLQSLSNIITLHLCEPRAKIYRRNDSLIAQRQS